MILSLPSLSSDSDSRTVNMATLTVWGLGISQYYVHEKTILNSVTTNKYYQIKNLKVWNKRFLAKSNKKSTHHREPNLLLWVKVNPSPPVLFVIRTVCNGHPLQY